MSAPFDDQGRQWAWDATSISLADECLRKYYYRMIEGWRPRTLSVHIDFGKHFATALERYYKYRALGHNSSDALESVIGATLIETWDYDRAEDGSPIAGTGKPHEFLHNAKTRENLIRTIIWYVDQFENESIEVVTLSDGRPAVEHSFSLHVTDDIVFSGHIDRLVRFVGDVYFMDQKTTGSTVSMNYFAQYSPNHQMSMYTFAGQAIYDMPVKGGIIDVAQIAVGFSRFERGFTFRTPTQLSEWFDTAMKIIETTRAATLEQNFPMRLTSCNNFGGCEFRGVCGRSPEVRRNFLLADFEQQPIWNPLEVR